MVFKGIYDDFLYFDIEYQDQSEQTGYICQQEINQLSLYLSFSNKLCFSAILVSEVQEVIRWFEKIALNKSVEPKLVILHKQFYFDLLENNSNLKVIRITYDTTIPIPGMGGYSLAPGSKKEDLFNKNFFECEMDNQEIERVVKKLTAELQIELQIGWQVESKKPKPND
ncbi:hypothetical protein KORDIASMS9_02494 [Kordia sp. SMS9]|uniref:WapI family immunity protein n=1 Tax=Kordia sp. SMS9 TaxID=2282170 RepID=UPI000E0DFC9E|nr:hypothetical protein [Kordia sp. SMS9]AXG70255.1 hypothetical protein KORDIASMS9_02494 [Kordia sp. SMS9]